MSLLDRVVETRQREESRPALLGELRQRLREMLFEQVPSATVAALLEGNPALAEREVEGALELALRSGGFEVLDEAERRRLLRDVRDMVVGLGPIQPLIDDPEVTEVMVNGPDSIFYEKDGSLHAHPARFDGEEQVLAVVDRILGPVGRRVDESSPMVSARLPQGHRVNVVVSPLAMDGPYVTIRKFREKSYSLDELVGLGSLDERTAGYLAEAVRMRRNIAVSGGTGSGKTTLLNALSREIPHDERIVTIEDSAELRFDAHPHVVRLEGRPPSADGCGEVTIRDLVTNALRMRPDRIIVGECRSAEALDMLQAMSTGHDGSLTTLHANSTFEAIGRLVMMVRFGVDLPVDVIESQVAAAIDLFVHVERQGDGSRKIVEISGCRASGGRAVVEPIALRDRKTQAMNWYGPELVRLPVAS